MLKFQIALLSNLFVKIERKDGFVFIYLFFIFFVFIYLFSILLIFFYIVVFLFILGNAKAVCNFYLTLIML